MPTSPVTNTSNTLLRLTPPSRATAAASGTTLHTPRAGPPPACASRRRAARPHPLLQRCQAVPSPARIAARCQLAAATA
ncbi:hypothetical protein E2562_013245 [Oryza meyeriana var. granulata]|uniref:Uncharacterized protein n=1 Tax=Oryza meyeriana var. granulata TaxID=110450 RepID=A0A6G1D358_9ORYZ|nr:hypothetical protein E2562_013245 [Oryza meyeriana var. granulata]